MSLSNEDLHFFNNKNNQHHQKVWLAAVNPQEFQRLMRFENCELIAIPSICDEIAARLTENTNQLLTIVSSPGQEAPNVMRSFFVASQYFIGLICVHEQQVKFLYDLASHCTIPARFLIEDQNIVAMSESEEEIRQASKKALKRKKSTKAPRTLKRKISLVIHTSDENDDIEAQNLNTMELLQSSFVAKNADISICEIEPIPLSNESNGSINCFGMQFNEECTVPERNDSGNASLEDGMMSMTLNQSPDAIDDVEVPTNGLESTRQFNDTVYGEAKNAEKLSPIPDEGAGCELGLENGSPGDSIEMNILAPPNISNSTRKRKRNRRNPPLKDITLDVNVKENVKTASTTQRHLQAKDDSVSKVACLSNLSRTIFVEPSHTCFSESMARQFESKSMSSKLVQSFKRMTLTKTEETNRDMVQEFCSNLQDNHQPDISMPQVENHVAIVPRLRTDSTLPFVELSLDGCNGQTISEQSMSIEEQITAPLTVEPLIYEDLPLITAEPLIYEHESIELPQSVCQILINNETVDSFVQCDTDSQKLFVSRSRQNKMDWGKEGVLKRLMSLWKSGVYPIGMKEIIQSNNQRISAATAFFSVMELNSTRIGLIILTKCPDSNVIFNITKSPKLIELHELV